MTEPLLSRLAASPDAYVQKIDLTRDAALLLQLSEEAYRSASFLDDRILKPGIQGGWVALARLLGVAPAHDVARPLHFIFHTGHVGSTLVSRLLEEYGGVLSLREPLPLRSLAEAHDVLTLPESLLSASAFESLASGMLRLWSRGYRSTHAVVLKATSSACRIARPLLERCPGSQAIYLNLRAEPYLATLLAGSNSAVDLRGHAPVRIRQLQARLGGAPAALHAMSLGELAAMSWLAETCNLRDAVAASDGRVVAVDFADFLLNVPAGMQRVVEHLRLPLDPQRVAASERSPVLARYSKSPDLEYSPQLRQELLTQSRRVNAAHIAQGLRWLEHLARTHTIVADVLTADNERRVM